MRKNLHGSIKVFIFAAVKQKDIGRVAQLNRASDYGSEGYRFESCRDHKRLPQEDFLRQPLVFLSNALNQCKSQGIPKKQGRLTFA